MLTCANKVEKFIIFAEISQKIIYEQIENFLHTGVTFCLL